MPEIQLLIMLVIPVIDYASNSVIDYASNSIINYVSNSTYIVSASLFKQ